MLVFVATPQQFEHAFEHWCEQTTSKNRLILHNVFNEFMASSQASCFLTTTQLYSFTFEHWLKQFESWRDSEILRQPQHLETIRYWCIQLSDLMQSTWSIQYKLIVKECLEECADITLPHSPDLLDSILFSEQIDDEPMPLNKAS